MKNGTLIIRLFIGLILMLILNLGVNIVAQTSEIQITTKSEEAKQLFLEGKKLLRSENYKDAAVKFENAVELDTDFALAYYYRFVTGVGGGIKSREYLKKALSLKNLISEGEKHLISFHSNWVNNNYNKAKNNLNHLLKILPNNATVLSRAGLFYYYANDYPKSFIFYEKVIELYPDRPGDWNMFGYVSMDLEKYDKAEKAFKKYIKLLPDKANPYDSYADFLQDRGRFEEAIEQNKKAYEKDKSFTLALRGIGDNYVFLGEYDKARKYYLKAQHKADNIAQILGAVFSRSLSYIYQNNIEEVLKVYDEYIEIAKVNNVMVNQALAKFWSAIISIENEKYDNAFKYLNEAEEIVEDDNFPERWKQRYLLYLGLHKCYALAKSGDLDDADEEAEKCLAFAKKLGNQNDLQYTYLRMAQLESKKNNYDKALENIKKADQTNAYVIFTTGLIYENNNEIDKAKECFKKVVNKKTNNLSLALVRNKAMKKL